MFPEITFPNGGHGIQVSGGSGYRIGTEFGNVISGNTGDGIRLQGSFTTGVSMRSNTIGGSFGNGGSGIRIEGPSNRVGADDFDTSGNTISNNTLNGIEIVGPDATGNLVDANVIVDNGLSGIRIVDASDNLIGVDHPNEIRGHSLNGIDVDEQGDITDRNTIAVNEITANTGFGIALFGDAQDGIDPPTTQLGNPGVFGTARPNATIELYADLDDEGEFSLGSVIANGSGNYLSLGSLALWAGLSLNATQTDISGNTSEFSVPLGIPTGGVSVPPSAGQSLCLNRLDGDQVVPPSGSDADGTARLSVDVVGTSVVLRVDHDVASPTTAEIRMGTPAENGPLVMDLGDPTSPILIPLGGTEFRAFTAGDHYLLISSAGQPTGDIRGPILCPEPGATILSFAAGLVLLGVRGTTRPAASRST